MHGNKLWTDKNRSTILSTKWKRDSREMREEREIRRRWNLDRAFNDENTTFLIESL